jgi:hypothetical protein
MEMKPEYLDKVLKVRKTLWFVNFPMMCVIPAAVYSDVLTCLSVAKQAKLFYLLHFADFFLLMNSGFLYIII